MRTWPASFLLFACGICFAQPISIEAAAAEVARQHNLNASSMLDEMTISTSAEAVGRNIRFSYVLRVKRGLPQAKRDEFQIELYKDMVPKICRANAENVAFDRGLYYTFIYTNTTGEKLAEFIVNKRACGRA